MSCEGDEVFFAEAGVGVGVAEDDVVEDGDADEAGGVDEAAGDGDVFA